MTSNTAHTVLDSVDNNVNDIKGFDELFDKDKATVRTYFTSEEEKIAHPHIWSKKSRMRNTRKRHVFSPANYKNIG
jgi:hypothetical protein